MLDVLALVAFLVALAAVAFVWADKGPRRVFEEWTAGELSALKKRVAAAEAKLDGGALPPKQ